MADETTRLLNLRLAWERIKRDQKRERVFVVHPHETNLIERQLDEWISLITKELNTGTYVPGPLYICDTPKNKGGVRPGGVLTLKDQLVYTAIVGALSPQIRTALDWENETVDYSYPITPEPANPSWILGYFPLWRSFCDDSIKLIADGRNEVVVADIAGYYEHIEIALLLSDLRAISADSSILGLLSKCLNKWSLSGISGRGLPQGFTASDILGRFYLNQVDRALRERGFRHLRYVDDIRIFCDKRETAKKGLFELSVLLRKRGLSLQSAKSGILNAEDAKRRIEGVQPVIGAILRKYVQSITDVFGLTVPYFSLQDAEDLLSTDVNEAPLEIIREAYRAYFIESDGGSFDKSLLRFLLKRLGNAPDRFALSHVLSILESHPEETDTVLKYVTKLGAVQECDQEILTYLISAQAIYSYQTYQCIIWRMNEQPAPGNSFTAFVRQVLFERVCEPYLKSICREYLARFGTSTDLDRLHDFLAVAHDDLERAELLCAIRRMESGRRNAVLARYDRSGFLTSEAVRILRSERKADSKEPRKKDWRRTVGMFAGNEFIKELDAECSAMREAERNAARGEPTE